MALVELKGIVLKNADYAEYDRRVVILTSECGKITAFAKGVKRPGSRYLAATEPFSFGVFRLIEGRNAYTLKEAEISNYFEGLRSDLTAYAYASYFLEIADYYSRENNDDLELLKLLYSGLKALLSPALENELISSVFLIKAIAVNGEYPGLPEGKVYLPGTLHSMRHILNSPPEKAFSFAVNGEVLKELKSIEKRLRDGCIGKRFMSLELLKDVP